MSDTKANPHRGYHAMLLDKLEELERENAALKQRILDDSKAYGCELRDPAGTIWDHAQRVQEENAALRERLINVTSELSVTKVNALADKERLDSRTILLTENGERVHHVEVNLRAAIDAAKEAQP